MARADEARSQRGDAPRELLQPRLRRLAEVHAAHDRAQLSRPGERKRAGERVGDTRVGTAEEHDCPLRRVDEEPLVVEERVGDAALPVPEETIRGRLGWSFPWNLAGQEDARPQLCRRDGPAHLADSFGEQSRGRGRHPDRSGGAIGGAGEAGLCRIGVEENRDASPGDRQRCQPPRVVVVAVAERDCIRGSEVDAHLPRVVPDGRRLSCVEQDAKAVRVDPEGEAMLGQDPCVAGDVINEDRAGHGTDHVSARWRRLVPACKTSPHRRQPPRAPHCAGAARPVTTARRSPGGTVALRPGAWGGRR